MLEGFLIIYFGIAASGIVLGAIIGVVIAKKNKKRGAIAGAIVGLIVGSAFAPVAVFDLSPPQKLPNPVVE